MKEQYITNNNLSDRKGYLIPLLETEYKEPYNMPRQQLPETYWQTGHVDVIRYATIKNKKSLTGDYILPIMIKQDYCVDIDTEKDLQYVEWLIMNDKILIPKPKKFNLK